MNAVMYVQGGKQDKIYKIGQFRRFSFSSKVHTYAP